MNKNKICFIYCVNDQRQYNESLQYIESMEIPEEYEIEFLMIEDAAGVACGYNGAMGKSDAKYKIYLHQDVFIINKNFLLDIIEIFNKNPNLGLLGVVGAKEIPDNGVWWESNQIYGKVYDSHTGEMSLLSFKEVNGIYEQVRAIDGLIMITQYDLPWREDLFKGWHFYDLSQSMEFILAGYEVGVPYQEKPWCIHDSGVANIKNGYEEYRNIFLDEYIKNKDGNPNKFFRFGINSKIEKETDIYGHRGISIGDNVLIQKDCWLLLPYNNFKGTPRIIIEDGCNIGRRSTISAVNKIVLGKNVLLAPNVLIADHNHQYGDVNKPIMHQGVTPDDNEIYIGDGTWIGTNCVITGMLSIGRGCVIGANTFINKDVPDFCVAVGNPFKIVKAYDIGSGQWVKVENEEHLKELLSRRRQ